MRCVRPGCRGVTRSYEGYCDRCRGVQTGTAGRIVTLVAGPPCSGKNHYVEQRRAPGDLVLDMDALRLALGSAEMHDVNGGHLLPFVSAARDAVLERLCQPHSLRRAWVIACAPLAHQRAIIPGASVVVLDTSADICHERAAAERPALWHQLIDDWFRDYEP